MCRWAAYIGKPLYLSDILIAPEHSLIDQSSSANKGKARLNADGFGLAWYSQKRSQVSLKTFFPLGRISIWRPWQIISDPVFFSHIFVRQQARR